MRASVAQSRYAMRSNQHLPDRIERAISIIGKRHENEILPLLLKQQIIGDLVWRNALGRGLRSDARFRRRLVARRITQRIHAIKEAREGEAGQTLVDWALIDDGAAHLGLAHFGDALGERQMRDLLIARLGAERMEADAMPQDHARRSRIDLSRNGGTISAVRGGRKAQTLAPALIPGL